MNTKQLRQKILDLAIRGKLVPQYPTDEPASTLLERVRAEKERLIQEGKIKRNKKDSATISGDDKLHNEKVPFDVPDGWEWCRLGDVCLDFQYGTSQKSEKQGKVAVLRMGNLQNGEVDYNDLAFTSDEADINKYSLNSNEILFNRTNSPEWVGKTAIYRGEMPAIFAGYLIRVTPVMINPFFLNFLMNSEYHRSICLQVKTDGVNQSNINAQKLSNFIYPLPPLTEQRRIVTAIESIFAVIDEIERNKTDLQAAVSAAKQKILALAIRGKFVAQDPNDEPASILLECVRTERETIVKEGKIKKDQLLPSITEKEIPFDLPDGWEWCRLSQIAIFSGGKTPSTSNSDFWNGSINWTTSKDMKSKYIDSTITKISELGAEQMQIFPPKTLLIVVRSGILRRTLPIAILRQESTVNQDIKTVSFYNDDVCEFIYSYFRAQEENILTQYAKSGTTVESINFEELKDIPLPIPPLAEQQRIVTAIEAAFEQLDMVVKNLDQ